MAAEFKAVNRGAPGGFDDEVFGRITYAPAGLAVFRRISPRPQDAAGRPATSSPTRVQAILRTVGTERGNGKLDIWHRQLLPRVREAGDLRGNDHQRACAKYEISPGHRRFFQSAKILPKPSGMWIHMVRSLAAGLRQDD